MAHEDDVVPGINFVENLNRLIIGEQTIDPGSNLILAEMLNQATAGTIDTYFDGFNAGTPFTDFDSFVAGFTGVSGGSDTDLEEATLNEIKIALNVIENAGDPGIGDWDLLSIPLAEVEQNIKNSLNHFLETYPYSGGNVTATEFFSNLRDFYTSTTHLTNTTAPVDFNKYEQVYLSFGFPAANYQARVQQFYNEVLEKTGGGNPALGYFIPSHEFDEWHEELVREYIVENAIDPTSGPLQPLDPDIIISRVETEAQRVLVIDRILKLLVAVIDVLHDISAAQAARLSILADWLSNYTELLEEVQPFTAGMEGVPELLGQELNFDGDATTAALSNAAIQGRAELNALNTSFIETIRARRDLVSDDSKAQQSTINQSQDAANQQTSIATAFIQQLSGILSAIFR